MWSQILLCMLVGLTYATNNPGWKENTVYDYEIRAQSLAGIPEIADQYSGIVLKAKLHVQPRSDGILTARISQPQYGQVHAQLPNGWQFNNNHDSELSFKDLPLTTKPFQIVMKDGVIRDLIVEKETQNWEANIIKSIASQFQLDTKAQNVIDSHVNTLPDDNSNNAVFKTMEETVTGEAETLYDIHQLPEHILESKPWLVRQPQLKGDGEYIEIVKSKNYSNSEQMPLYQYGLDGISHWKSASNQMGEFFVRYGVTKAILSGKLSRFTIQSTHTINEIYMSPTLNDKQKAAVLSSLNITLEDVRSHSTQEQELSAPVSLKSLVYRFNLPFHTNEARPMEFQENHQQQDQSYRSSEERFNSPSQGRFRRNVPEYNEEYELRENFQQQERPQMQSAPSSPLLPLTIGFRGKSINEHIDIVRRAKQFAQEIAEEIQNPEKILEKGTLEKYRYLTVVTRLMDEDQMKQVAEQLYSQEQNGVKRDAWIAFRDAVAETGTGPAFRTVQKWIQTKKIVEEEAAQIVATMAKNVREPTEQYMRDFFGLITNPEVVSQQSLNETALLAYTDLLRTVYVDKYASRNQYPRSFGSFRTEEGKKFLKETVIPHLSKHLQEAVTRGDNRKVLVYIRALGNVAHRQILQAFEPYLEGQKQASQFQRVMMIVNFNKLAKVNPVLARSVLYKVYQNTGEVEEVRVAAVYQLMRTSPPTDILLRMAEYTKIDQHEHVNAAVKSSIESAAELEQPEFRFLRSSARAAKPLLTHKTYGIQHGGNLLRNYVADELNLAYKETTQQIGSSDSYLPKSIRLALRQTTGGFSRQLFDLEASVSSIDELLNVLGQQTEHQQQAELQSRQDDSDKLSSEYVARLLNLQSNEREQLEGLLRLELGSLQKLWIFDNRTIEELPQLVEKLEEMLKNGKDIHYGKLMHREEIVLSFPTEMGLPFLFTYNQPILVHVSGKVEASASPAVSQQGKLHQPNTVTANVDLKVTISGENHGRLSFITPFDHEQYSTGYNKVLQVHIPVHGKINFDVKNKQVVAELTPKTENTAPLFHISSWPYTSKQDITNMEPVATRPTTQTIHSASEQIFDKVLGTQYTGLAVRVQMLHQPKYMNLIWLYQLAKERSLPSLMTLWNEAEIQHAKINVRLVPEETTTRKVVIRFGYQNQQKTQYEDESNTSTSNNDFSEISKNSDDSIARQQEFLKKVSPGIHNAHIKSFDASVEFQGGKIYKYVMTGAMAKSNVDPKSKVLIYFQKSSNTEESKPYQMGLSIKSNIPNTNGLDLTDSFKQEPTLNSKMELSFGQNYEQSSKIHAQIEMRRSNERKQYLMEEPTYFQCRREMQQGDNQLPACANMTVRANHLDESEIKLQYENLKPEYEQIVKEIFNTARFNFLPTLSIKKVPTSGQKQINVKTRFFHNFEAVNVSVHAEDEETSIHNVYIQEWVRPFVAVHPVFHLNSRLAGKYFALENYRQSCVVDKNHANTFNNKTYPLGSLRNLWTVMLQYVPLQARPVNKQQQQTVEEQLKQQIENYLVLVRENQDNNKQKDVKITLRVPETKGKLLDITMQPSSSNLSGKSGSNPTAKVLVNGQEIKVNDKQSHDIEENLVQIYALRNGEVKVEVQNAFYVLYDGVRVKVTAISGKLRESVRGLCGQFNDDKSTDLLTSENCVARDVRDFIESYQLNGEQQRSTQLKNGNKCYEQNIYYANVISDSDAGREQGANGLVRKQGYTRYQTKYVERNNGQEICFTIRAMPVCNFRQIGESMYKNVKVHCMQDGVPARMWKKQVESGLSLDFTSKTITTELQMELPKQCGK